MSVKIKNAKIKDHHAIVIQGDIIGETASKITAKASLLLKKNVDSMIIQLVNTNLIDSYGLGAFVYIWKQANEQKCSLVFLCDNNFDTNIFSSANLDKIFKIVTSVDDI